jgi:branched-chain amino acid aminotransferase
MSFLASVNGVIGPAEEARVSVLDNGFTFGDSVYETLRTYRGRPYRLDLHLRRLRTSAGRLAIDIPVDDPALARSLDALLAKAENPESYIRMIVSRGVGDISYRFERVKGPTIVLAVKPYEPPPEHEYRDGVEVSVVSVRRNHPDALDPAIKSCNLLNNVLAVREAQKKRASEAILLNQRGEVAEGASSNLFIVREGRVVTPPLSAGILPGITRQVVLELGRSLGLPSGEETVSLPDLLGADEAFLTSTIREVLPIRSVDGRAVGAGRPGPLTVRLLSALRAEANAEAPVGGSGR